MVTVFHAFVLLIVAFMLNNTLQILISSGAHLSRYLVQVAMHHYFRSQAQFVKGPWVRTLAFPDFSYFMLKAGEIYGDIPSAKGEDDGSVFTTFLKESRFSKEMRSVGWEDIREILEKYKVRHFAQDVGNVLAQSGYAISLCLLPPKIHLWHSSLWHFLWSHGCFHTLSLMASAWITR